MIKSVTTYDTTKNALILTGIEIRQTEYATTAVQRRTETLNNHYNKSGIWKNDFFSSRQDQEENFEKFWESWWEQEFSLADQFYHHNN